MESQREDKIELIKYFTQQKQLADYNMSKMREELRAAKEKASHFTQILEEEEAFKLKLFKGNKGDKFYRIQKEMESLEEIERRQEKLGYVGPMHLDSYSGVERDLEKVKDSMMKETGLIGGGPVKNKLPDRIQAVPFDQFQVLMENRTSNLQKRTAFKTLERFFKNVSTSNQACQTESFDEENEKLKTLKQEVFRMKE